MVLVRKSGSMKRQSQSPCSTLTGIPSASVVHAMATYSFKLFHQTQLSSRRCQIYTISRYISKHYWWRDCACWINALILLIFMQISYLRCPCQVYEMRNSKNLPCFIQSFGVTLCCWHAHSSNLCFHSALCIVASKSSCLQLVSIVHFEIRECYYYYLLNCTKI